MPSARALLGVIVSRGAARCGAVRARWWRVWESMTTTNTASERQDETGLATAAASPRPTARIAVALAYGFICHVIFALASLAMAYGLFTGMTQTFGAAPQPFAALANGLLLIQFPLAHSFLLSARGRAALARLAPLGFGKTLATTTYATIASLQLLALFTLWTPTGVIVWRAEGAAFAAMSVAYAASWVLLAKASSDAGLQLQSGALGWVALLRNREPAFPDMPEKGLFMIVRQPIYVSFALVLWTTPTWTVDQLAIAGLYTAYCLFAPLLKERRFLRLYGERFARYRARVPYWLPFGNHRPSAGGARARSRPPHETTGSA